MNKDKQPTEIAKPTQEEIEKEVKEILSVMFPTLNYDLASEHPDLKERWSNLALRNLTHLSTITKERDDYKQAHADELEGNRILALEMGGMKEGERFRNFCKRVADERNHLLTQLELSQSNLARCVEGINTAIFNLVGERGELGKTDGARIYNSQLALKVLKDTLTSLPSTTNLCERVRELEENQKLLFEAVKESSSMLAFLHGAFDNQLKPKDRERIESLHELNRKAIAQAALTPTEGE